MKSFENVLYDQISSFYENILKNVNPQSYQVAMIEKSKISLDQGSEYAALLTDHSKGFDCLLHDLIIGKLNAYGSDKALLRLMQRCLTGRY